MSEGSETPSEEERSAFRPLTRESLATIEARIEEENAKKKELQHKKEKEGQRRPCACQSCLVPVLSSFIPRPGILPFTREMPAARVFKEPELLFPEKETLSGTDSESESDFEMTFKQVRYEEEDEDDGPQPDSALEAGMPLPLRLAAEFASDLVATPLEDIDPYYANQRLRRKNRVLNYSGRSSVSGPVHAAWARWLAPSPPPQGHVLNPRDGQAIQPSTSMVSMETHFQNTALVLRIRTPRCAVETPLNADFLEGARKLGKCVSWSLPRSTITNSFLGIDLE
ncbi:unnamed protein product [Notodromas monacha]|uniref:Uncharacterized protein n=1 Tax=Notodromas monacha TaxID=399045 RepID=A0A7R9G7Y1_9CRUS|nr:unnamed protein product [Notodromas monacha]CAG0912695.1 unnamed protein product [Notodromas monacha]